MRKAVGAASGFEAIRLVYVSNTIYKRVVFGACIFFSFWVNGFVPETLCAMWPPPLIDKKLPSKSRTRYDQALVYILLLIRIPIVICMIPG